MSKKFPSPEFGEPPKEAKKQELGAKEIGAEIDPSPDKSARPENIESSYLIDKSAERLRQIEEIRRKLIEGREQTRPREEDSAIKNTTETVTVRGRQYTVEYVPKEEIYPAFGYGGGDRAVVRQDLSPRVKRFVRAHELYHCQDQAVWGGWLGKEIRANVVPGLKDPIGLFATVWATVSDFERIKFYLKRAKESR